MIEEDYAPLGSAHNPIIIHVEEDYDRSGLTILVPTKSPLCEDPEKSQAPRQSYVNHARTNLKSTSHGDRKDESERGRFESLLLPLFSNNS